ncbi:DUF4222 domain-containing protein [Yersinia enterocolitica]|uniref:DUF4222 domain-containing protein n=1 Tax=Yersinia enterocolitica TaxID=630 RepID=UPI002AB1C48C|nr:DUF4222 domain-containing protein [Yersinia enterocolitica]
MGTVHHSRARELWVRFAVSGAAYDKSRLNYYNPIQLLDRYYNDKRGVRVHVIGYDNATGKVIFRRDDYEHDCSIPIRRFRKEYKAVV